MAIPRFFTHERSSTHVKNSKHQDKAERRQFASTRMSIRDSSCGTKNRINRDVDYGDRAAACPRKGHSCRGNRCWAPRVTFIILSRELHPWRPASARYLFWDTIPSAFCVSLSLSFCVRCMSGISNEAKSFAAARHSHGVQFAEGRAVFSFSLSLSFGSTRHCDERSSQLHEISHCVIK